MLRGRTAFADSFTGVRDLAEGPPARPGLQSFDQRLDANGHPMPTK